MFGERVFWTNSNYKGPFPQSHVSLFLFPQAFHAVELLVFCFLSSQQIALYLCSHINMTAALFRLLTSRTSRTSVPHSFWHTSHCGTQEFPLKNASVIITVLNACLGLEEYLSLPGYQYFSRECWVRGFLRKLVSHCGNCSRVHLVHLDNDFVSNLCVLRWVRNVFEAALTTPQCLSFQVSKYSVKTESSLD